MGTAQVQGELWGAKARDWAELQEPAWNLVFETALSLAGVRPGLALLDIGCGAGGALLIARKAGAEVAGIDGSKNLITIARERLPGARLEVSEMEELPFADDRFDIVTGINAFQFAEDLIRALSEARRVCRCGASVFMLTWGRPEDCQLMSVTMRSVVAMLPAPSPGSKSSGAPIEQPAAEKAMREAGLEIMQTGEFAADLVFVDASTAVRALLSAGVTVRASRLLGEETVRQTLRGTLGPVTRTDGSVAWNNRFRWIVARKPDKT